MTENRYEKHCPCTVSELREFRKLGEIEGTILEEAAAAKETLERNQWILTAEKSGLLRLAGMMGFFGAEQMETEELREEILSRWCSRSPYTYFHLQDWLDGCVGAGNYTGTLERESYRLRLVLELCVKEKREFLQKHLRKIIPANLVLQVNLNVNTHGKLHRIRHGEMKEKGLTYGGIPFEILPEEERNSAVSGKKLLQRMRGCATIQK